ncbi:type I-F CRISPR-associated endoribonuclease Cas6/Csy4 [Formicincola oecophyllae]|uniref:Type I-F CRISPR-associated endoribonuclease Cas6/Csy4 n=1 Tax=Formicincola oecophyllae TaxID=2558361 RepID=A0A4Y6U7U8_9PROT|nr:type I-F CRISPR-associated endoribonuclease Cas6/Csy4 [Formicincola oecophyllae]QDH13224.1 type I-F CRISPR-associated endoribonuclease Cas6/Csy4 [Formicincola oecophyllae]
MSNPSPKDNKGGRQALTHYADVRLLDDPEEMMCSVVMGILMERLHFALLNTPHSGGEGSLAGHVGVSFPRYQGASAGAPMGLGDVLRLHGDAPSLQALLRSSEWDSVLRDYTAVKDPQEVPPDAAQCRVQRVQGMTMAKLRRKRQHQRAKFGLSEEQARIQCPDSMAQPQHKPAVHAACETNGALRQAHAGVFQRLRPWRAWPAW